MDFTAELTGKGARAKEAARKLATLSTTTKNAALVKMAACNQYARAEGAIEAGADCEARAGTAG